MFVNSDPCLLDLFVRFVEAQGVDRAAATYRVLIHQRVDAEAASQWWAERLQLPGDRFRRPTLKRHVPVTNRRNTGEDYHGCLVITVPRSRELYWTVEDPMRAITAVG